jgi:hypothetical protein
MTLPELAECPEKEINKIIKKYKFLLCVLCGLCEK